MKKISYGVLALFVLLGLTACIPIPNPKAGKTGSSERHSKVTTVTETTTETTTSEAAVTTDKYKYTQESDGIQQEILVSLTYKGTEYQSFKIDMTHTFSEEQQAQMRALDPATVQEVLGEYLNEEPGMSDLTGIEGVSLTSSLTEDYKWLVSITIDAKKTDFERLAQVEGFALDFTEVKNMSPKLFGLSLRIYGFEEVKE
ncbi:hypothetical protein DDV21_006550 [Streptococcus chenjunshii]|uniref:SP-0191-like C-terminal domain-containing protein n=1 Tax=Streptococcus chenjunshii TaxID=2173853 RepID=A0A372KNV7_9STRE|nr:SP0191 family lipoprotein [Streptococcus chenjunshii]AXQ78766.1 hypothetical protein DDV21_006550 [Streptococcus chenjunshii]RFU51641.1 hypothetical protein DDV22_01990 [Streptococcus chenjunshii]RFU53962.1 hypothetical protein DDV23_00050 [Streptococcus chenjunshii]